MAQNNSGLMQEAVDISVDSGGATGHFAGLLFVRPTVGERLLIGRVAQGDVLKTSMVRSVALEPDGSVLVQTMNSTYRLRFNAVDRAVDKAA